MKKSKLLTLLFSGMALISLFILSSCNDNNNKDIYNKEDNIKYYFLSAITYDSFHYFLSEGNKIAVKFIKDNTISSKSESIEINNQKELKSDKGYVLTYMKYESSDRILLETELNVKVELNKYYVFSILDDNSIQTDYFEDFNDLKNNVSSIILGQSNMINEEPIEDVNQSKNEEDLKNNESTKDDFLDKDVCNANDECE